MVSLTNGIITGTSGVLTGSAYKMLNGTNSASLGGGAALTMNGTALYLAGNSTYSGGTTISNGTVRLGSTNALGSGSVTLTAGTFLDLNGQTNANQIIVSGASTLENLGGIAAAVTANSTLNNTLTIDTTGGNITVARLIGGVTRTVNVNGANTLTFNGAGHNNLVALVVGSDSAYPTLVCANNGGYSADRGVTLDTGTIRLAGPGSGGAYPNANLINSSQQFWIPGPGTLDLNGWNQTLPTVYGVSVAVIENTAVGTNSTLTLGADNGTNTWSVSPLNVYSGTVQDGGGVLSLTKIGFGTQIINGTSTYSGTTTINNGQLEITASGASPNSTYVVNTNGGLLFQTDTSFHLGGLSGGGNVSVSYTHLTLPTNREV